MYNDTILLGVLVSLIYTELTGLSAGLIVPGYLVLYLHSPARLGYTLLVAGAAALICRGLSRFVILYGRRRFAVLILLTFFLSMAVDALGLAQLSVVGVVLPGIIARELDRQGPRDALLSMSVTTALTALALLAFGRGLAGW